MDLKTKKYINKALIKHGDRYCYDNTVYINWNTKITITCKKHGDFQQRPDSHLASNGCQKCGHEDRYKKTRCTKKKFVKKAIKIHGKKYNYDKVIYLNNCKKVIIICEEHGEFKQSPHHHTEGNGCPRCSDSKGEEKISRILERMGIEFTRQKIYDKCKFIRVPFDFYIPEYNILIEYNGIQHYKPIGLFGGEEHLKYRQNNDNIKKNYCKENNIPLLIIRYDDKDIEKTIKDFIAKIDEKIILEKEDEIDI